MTNFFSTPNDFHISYGTFLERQDYVCKKNQWMTNETSISYLFWSQSQATDFLIIFSRLTLRNHFLFLILVSKQEFDKKIFSSIFQPFSPSFVRGCKLSKVSFCDYAKKVFSPSVEIRFENFIFLKIEVSIWDFAETDVHAVGVNGRWKSDFRLRFS